MDELAWGIGDGLFEFSRKFAFGTALRSPCWPLFDSLNESARSLRRLRVVRRVTDREGLQAFRAVGPAPFHLAYRAPGPRDFGSGMGIDDLRAVVRRVSPRSDADRGSWATNGTGLLWYRPQTIQDPIRFPPDAFRLRATYPIVRPGYK